MTYSYENAEEKLRAKPKKFVFSRAKRNLIPRLIAAYLSAGGTFQQ